MERDCVKAISYAYAMDSLMYVILCIRPGICFVIRIMSGLVLFLIRVLGGCQTYTQVSLENKRLYVCVSLR